MEDGVIAVDVRRRADTPATRGRPPTVHASSTSPRRVCLRACRSPPGSSSCPHHLRPQGTRTAGISEGCESRGLHEQHGARQKWWRSRRCRWQATPSQHCPTGGGCNEAVQSPIRATTFFFLHRGHGSSKVTNRATESRERCIGWNDWAQDARF